MGIPDCLTCLLRNLYVGQEATVRTGHGTMDWFQLGKGVHQAAYCHLAYLTYMQSRLCEMPDWMKHKLESRLLGEITITNQIGRNEGCRWQGTSSSIPKRVRFVQLTVRPLKGLLIEECHVQTCLTAAKSCVGGGEKERKFWKK